MSPSSLACVLFDLDGTLLDTAPDMARALNQLLDERGRAPLPFAAIRPVVSHGARGLIELGFGVGLDDPGFAVLQQRYLEIYNAGLALETALFPGMEEAIATLEARALPWGVVTNKPGWLTEPLLASLALRRRAACVVSGDTIPQRKPDPAPLRYAARQVGVAPDACVYVGDAERDIEAGRRAGMATAVAGYGYFHAHEDPYAWGADTVIAEPTELLEWLGVRR
ncbi:MAG: phosphoglycolate phosphatase [Gammaproteobacteria bacterium]